MKSSRGTRLAKFLVKDPCYLLWQGRSRLLYKAMEPYTFLSRGRGFPRMSIVTFFLTWACNLRCVMCNLWGTEGSCFQPKATRRTTISVEHWLQAVRGLQPFGAEILLTGGEPLLFRDWAKIAEAAHRAHLPVSLITNGSLLEAHLEPICQFVDRLNISLDGPSDIHNAIRKEAGHFELVRAGIERIDREKRVRKQSRPYINIACTIQERNVQTLFSLGQALAGWNVSIHTLIFQHQEFIGEKGWAETERAYHDLGAELEIWQGFRQVPQVDVQMLCRQKHLLEKASFSFPCFFFPSFDDCEILRYYSTPDSFVHSQSRRCIGPWVEALITPQGDFWICPDYATGNICQTSIAALWNNERARTLRHHLQKKGPLAPICRCCQCFYTR